MDGFDFNIQNYSLSEMEDLLGLASKNGKGGYTPGDVASCKQRLVVKLASSGKQDKKMTDFLNAVHKCLLSKLDNSGTSGSIGSSGNDNNGGVKIEQSVEKVIASKENAGRSPTAILTWKL